MASVRNRSAMSEANKELAKRFFEEGWGKSRRRDLRKWRSHNGTRKPSPQVEERVLAYPMYSM